MYPVTDPMIAHARPRSLDAQLCFALYSTSMAMTRAYRPMLDRLGLTYPQVLVLHVLWEQDGASIGEIAERLSLESSTITPLVKRMAAAGHVRRERDPADERYVRIRLTPAGEALQAEVACIGDAVFEKTGLDMDQVVVLTGQMVTIRTALGRAANDP